MDESWRGNPAAIEVEHISANACAECEGLSVHKRFGWRRRLRDRMNEIAPDNRPRPVCPGRLLLAAVKCSIHGRAVIFDMAPDMRR